MQQNWGRLIAVFGVILLLLPGIRRLAFRRIIRNDTIRRMGIQTFLAIPLVREKMLGRLFSNR